MYLCVSHESGKVCNSSELTCTCVFLMRVARSATVLSKHVSTCVFLKSVARSVAEELAVFLDM